MAKTPDHPDQGRDSLKKLRADVVLLDERLSRADSATKKSVKALQNAYSNLGAKSGAQTQDDLRDYVDSLAGQLERRILNVRADISAILAAGMSDPRLDKVAQAVQAAQSQLAGAELHQAEAIAKINGHIARLAGALDARLQMQAREQAAIKAELSGRIDTASAKNAQKISETAQGIEAINHRIIEVESQSADAILSIGERIATLTTAMQDRLDQSDAGAQEKLAELALDHQQRFEKHKAETTRMFDVVEEEHRNSIEPVQHSIATVFSRLEALETGMVNVITPAPRNAVPPFPPAPLDDAPEETQPWRVAALTAVPYMADAFTAPPPAARLEPVETPVNPYGAAQMDQGGAQIHHMGGGGGSQYFEDATAQMNGEYGNPYGSPGAMQDYAAQSFGAPDMTQPYAQNQYADTNGASDPSMSILANDLGAATMDMARPATENAKSGGKMRRLLRTAATAAALVAVVSTGALMLRGKLAQSGNDRAIASATLPAGTPDPGSADVDNSDLSEINFDPLTLGSPPADGSLQYDVTLTEPTGNMSQPDMSPTAAMTTDVQYDTLMEAVEAGNPIAQMQHGVTLLRSGKAEQGASYVRKAASQGLTPAQYVLGHLYDTGEGVKVDKALARELTQKAAMGGHRVAMYDLAVYYVDEAEAASAAGEGPKAQAAMGRAVQWFRKAGEFGMTDAQFNVAVLYDQGNGIASDPAEAYFWYAIAGQAGDQESASRAQQLSAKLTPDMRARMDSRIADFRPSDFSLSANGIFPNVPWEKKVAVNNREKVARVQTLLANIGYDIGGVDGAAGPRTRDAIREFERLNSLPITGKVSDPLLQRLENAAKA
ncbi:SEL1-like repeat protein [Robiginitomaculum antarcticum]|uniref:SEL1-like repeat protein n=1 Tax=Robiginitomaculum antarcticum TaxID=437507 RepID=UPI00036E5E42|nr:SEL1-like repeat protein [Robiginitomaculum antarcticum]